MIPISGKDATPIKSCRPISVLAPETIANPNRKRKAIPYCPFLVRKQVIKKNQTLDPWLFIQTINILRNADW